MCLAFTFLLLLILLGSVAGSGASSCVGILSKFFIANNLLLKPFRNFFLTLNNNPKLYKKRLFSSVFKPLSKFFNSLAKLFCSLSAFSIDKKVVNI